MPFDCAGWEDGDNSGNRSITLTFDQNTLERLNRMLELSRNFVDLRRTKPAETLQMLAYETIAAYIYYLQEVRGNNRELGKYKDDVLVATVNLVLKRVVSGSNPANNQAEAGRITLHFSDVGWTRLEGLQALASCETKTEFVAESFRFYEWGVLEAEKGFEIGSSNPKTGMIEIVFRNGT